MVIKMQCSVEEFLELLKYLHSDTDTLRTADAKDGFHGASSRRPAKHSDGCACQPDVKTDLLGVTICPD